MNKKVISIMFSVICLFMLSLNTYASGANESETIMEDIDNVYRNAYENAEKIDIQNIETDDVAYALLKQNIDLVEFDDNGNIDVNYENLKLRVALSVEEKIFVENFVKRLNTLIDLEAVVVNKSLLISSVENIESERNVMQRSAVISIMGEARSHATTLKQVYDNAVFGTKNAVAGQYFAERVKTGGVWDYKSYLGVKTVYYVDDLSTTMTGEAIGNFHYGYVGRSVFSATTLKSAAGMYQIYSGTASIEYWKTFFDEPTDQVQIQRGIDKYEADN